MPFFIGLQIYFLFYIENNSFKNTLRLTVWIHIRPDTAHESIPVFYYIGTICKIVSTWGYKTWVHFQTQNKAQWLTACRHVSASSLSLRFILGLRLYSSYITSRPCFLNFLPKLPITYLISDGSYVSREITIRGELVDMFHHPLHHLNVTFSKGSHETRDLSVVLTINVCSCCHY